MKIGIRRRIRHTKAQILLKSKILSRLVTYLIYPSWIEKNGTKIEELRIKFEPEKQYNPKELTELKKDICYVKVHYSMVPEEYFRYRFDDLPEEERDNYISQYFLTFKFVELCDQYSRDILNSKEKTAQVFQKYYKRDVICVKDLSDKDTFYSFIKKHNSFIVKPQSSKGGGNGVYIETVNNNADQIFQKIVKKGSSVLEELIDQADEMKVFHPQSVNTIRVVTCIKNDISQVVQATIRMGTGDSVVDNGCLSAAINIQTGEIITPGRNAHSAGLYTFHPNTNTKILGNIIPRWKELMDIMNELPLILPKQRIIGWDMALSNDGWVVIEGNTNPAIQILAGNGIGVKKLFESITTR